MHDRPPGLRSSEDRELLSPVESCGNLGVAPATDSATASRYECQPSAAANIVGMGAMRILSLLDQAVQAYVRGSMSFHGVERGHPR